MALIHSLVKYYPKMNREILKGYKEAPNEIIYHEDDKDLDTIVVKLPEPPRYDQIDGFGKKAKDQKFEHTKYPIRLKHLEGDFETIDDLWAYLKQNQRYYKDEIDFIRREWKRRIYGYWFFNNGVPTFIDGWHYFYLNYWPLDTGLPYYKDRDRKVFHFFRFAYTDTKLPDGTDLHDRVCLGVNYTKHRREGATSKASCVHYEIISRKMSVHGGIQSMNESDAKMVFKKHIIPQFKKMKFFFKPNYSGSTDPEKILSFNPPAEKQTIKGSRISSKVGLESTITYKNASIGAYDGDKLYFHHGDEEGKTTRENVLDRHMVIRKCMAQGDGGIIHGFIINTTTVGKMEKGGGDIFKQKCEYSQYSERNHNGMTITGLYNLFIPASEGLDGFIDQFGNSVVSDPEPWQDYGKKRTKKGAEQFLLENRESLLKRKDYENLNKQIRQAPLKFKECFRYANKDVGFNLSKIETRLDDLRFRNKTRRGDFLWTNGFGTKVEWMDNDKGRFIRSYFGNFKKNHQTIDPVSGDKIPIDDNNFFAGADPFKFNKTQGNRKSKGGGAVFWKRDYAIDPEDKPMNKWESERFICTYNVRAHDKDEYAEDMLKMCVFFSCRMFPEIDTPLIWDKFEEWGYGGYLMYDTDRKTGKLKETPGAHAISSVQAIFQRYMTHIERHCEREEHPELLMELRDIDGPEDMTNYDLFAAGGYAMLGAESKWGEIQRINHEEYSLGDYLEEYHY